MPTQTKEMKAKIATFRKKVIELISQGINTRLEIESSLMMCDISRNLAGMVKAGILASEKHPGKRDRYGNRVVRYRIGSGKRVTVKSQEIITEEIQSTELFSVWQIPLPKGGKPKQFSLTDKHHNNRGLYKTSFGIQSSMGLF